MKGASKKNGKWECRFYDEMRKKQQEGRGGQGGGQGRGGNQQ